MDPREGWFFGRRKNNKKAKSWAITPARKNYCGDTMNHRVLTVAGMAVVLYLLLPTDRSLAQTQVGNYVSHTNSGRSVVITGSTGESLRVTPYGDYMVRVQVVKKGEAFYADDRYEMVASHDWTGTLEAVDGDSSLTLSTGADDGVSLVIAKQPMRIAFSIKGQSAALLSEDGGVTWSGNTVKESFTSNTDEHFAGLGHEAYGRIAKLDRRGTSLKVSKASEGALVAPFYVSSARLRRLPEHYFHPHDRAGPEQQLFADHRR